MPCLTRSLRLVLTIAASAAGAAPAMAADPPLALQTFATGLTQPVFVTHAPQDPSSIYIVEQRGKVKVVRNGSVLPTPMVDVASLMTGSDAYVLEYGLLGLAFHPNFATNGYFYVNFTVGTSNLADTVVMRFKTLPGNPDVADFNSRVQILRIPYTIKQHRAGWMDFGTDGKLYIATGDGGENDPLNAGSDLTVLKGKILRIDVNGPDGVPGTADDDGFPADANKNYVIPASNPFVSTPGAAGEIWCYGLRNPWRCSFDRQTGDLWIGDVGQGQREEVDMVVPASAGGSFFGWRCIEGTLPTNFAGCPAQLPPSVPPVYEYTHAVGTAVIGGYVYRGCLMPALRGTYFFGDWNQKTWSFRLVGGSVTSFTNRQPEFPFGMTFVSFGEDYDGEMYACAWSTTAGNSTVYKIIEAGRPIPDCNVNGIDDALELCRGAAVSPAIAVPPAPVTTCPGSSASFRIDAVGAGLSYQWQRETAPGSNTYVALSDGPTAPWDGNAPGIGAVVSGSTTPLLTVAADTSASRHLSGPHAIRYRCSASNGCGSDTSAPAALSLLPDLNLSGAVDTPDLTIVLGDFGHAVTPYTSGDVTGDGFVSTSDLTALLGSFGSTCPAP